MNDGISPSASGAGEAVDQEQVRAETVSLLQDLGLKEYEARCFVALTRVPAATAKEVSDLSEVPRTRVYDAVRLLEAHGLVAVQHTSPQRFRAVGVDEAAATLRQRYDDRIDTLRSSLASLDVEDEADEPDTLQEVWSMTGAGGIQSRTAEMVEGADSEVVLLVVEADLLTDALFDRLRAAVDRGVDVVVGGRTEAVVDTIESELPAVDAFETELDWLMGPEDDGEVAISRLLLVDRTTLLVSSYYPEGDHEGPSERAIFADGLTNGIVVLARRLIASGLLPSTDPAA